MDTDEPKLSKEAREAAEAAKRAAKGAKKAEKEQRKDDSKEGSGVSYPYPVQTILTPGGNSRQKGPNLNPSRKQRTRK